MKASWQNRGMKHTVYRVFSRQHTVNDTRSGVFAVSLISVNKRRSYPMLMEQIVRGETSTTPKMTQTPPKKATISKTSEAKGDQPGRPKGSKNRNKTEVVLNDTLKQIQSMLKTVLATIGGLYRFDTFCLMDTSETIIHYRWSETAVSI